jgi:hypothetical protein
MDQASLIHSLLDLGLLVSEQESEVMCTLADVFMLRLTRSEEYECLHSMMGHCSSAGSLVIGGLGGLGLLAAGQIQTFVFPSLSLISRSRSVSRGLDILDMLHAHESVALVRCDVSKAHRTASLMLGIHQQSVSSIGLVHASGTQAFTAITDQRPFRFE